MYLSGALILHLVEAGDLAIDPFDEVWLRSASYTLHLSGRHRRWRQTGEPIDVWSPDAYRDALGEVSETDSLEIHPGEFVLCESVEAVGLAAGIAGTIATLSHLARIGLAVHLGAEWVSPGFGSGRASRLALELVNHNPNVLRLPAGLPICHLRVSEVSGPPRAVERSLYENQDALIEPKLYEHYSSVGHLGTVGGEGAAPRRPVTKTKLLST